MKLAFVATLSCLVAFLASYLCGCSAQASLPPVISEAQAQEVVPVAQTTPAKTISTTEELLVTNILSSACAPGCEDKQCHMECVLASMDCLAVLDFELRTKSASILGCIDKPKTEESAP